jgi:hypothetical protein
MNRAFRSFLAWVMVLAMPVQGMAASAMLSCGPSHQRMMQGWVLGQAAAAADHAHGHGDCLASMDAIDPEHAVPGHSVASEYAPGTDAEGVSGMSAHHGDFSCSACAACCSLLALPSGFELAHVVGLAASVRAPLVAPVTSYQPDRLDRPPRAVLP